MCAYACNPYNILMFANALMLQPTATLVFWSQPTDWWETLIRKFPTFGEHQKYAALFSRIQSFNSVYIIHIYISTWLHSIIWTRTYPKMDYLYTTLFQFRHGFWNHISRISLRTGHLSSGPSSKDETRDSDGEKTPLQWWDHWTCGFTLAWLSMTF